MQWQTLINGAMEPVLDIPFKSPLFAVSRQLSSAQTELVMTVASAAAAKGFIAGVASVDTVAIAVNGHDAGEANGGDDLRREMSELVIAEAERLELLAKAFPADVGSMPVAIDNVVAAGLRALAAQIAGRAKP